MGRGSHHARSGTAVAVYAVAWVCLGAVTAALLILVLRGFGDRDTLPPLTQTSFAGAMQAGDCTLVRPMGAATGNPPAAGPAGPAPTAPGVYARAPGSAGLVAALRRGVVELHYRSSLDGSRLAELEAMQAVVPRTTIVTPNQTRMPYVVAAVGWRAILGCRRFSDATLDALRLFRARNIGRGPDVAAP